MFFDLLIRNGRVVDGLGNPWFRADVGITQGRIAAVGRLASSQAETVIDAQGKVICPGFIDVHNHSDLILLREPDHTPKVAQGITTEILGSDGLGYAPMSPKHLRETTQLYRAINGGLPQDVELWQTIPEYMDRFDRKVAVNVAYQVPHNALRLAVIGWENRAATEDDLRQMARLAAEAMEQGCVGFATGLSYHPHVFSTLEELVAISKAVAAYGGVYNTHMRYHLGDQFLDPVHETLDVARQADIPVHIAHYLISGIHTWGLSSQRLALVDSARAEGLDVTYDAYCYPAGSTTGMFVLPLWMGADGPKAMLKRVRSPNVMAQILDEIEGRERDFYARMQITHIGMEQYRQWEGRRLADVADECGEAPDVLLLRLLDETALDIGFTFHFGNEADVQAVIKHPAHMGSTDAIMMGSSPHPRAYGTYPRYLGHYTRELGLFTLEDAIRRFTGFPAQRFGLHDRGIIRNGMAADIVVFDPATVIDRSTFDDPRQFPVGIEHVLVNGTPVIADSAPTGARPGRALRRG